MGIHPPHGYPRLQQNFHCRTIAMGILATAMRCRLFFNIIKLRIKLLKENYCIWQRQQYYHFHSILCEHCQLLYWVLKRKPSSFDYGNNVMIMNYYFRSASPTVPSSFQKRIWWDSGEFFSRLTLKFSPPIVNRYLSSYPPILLSSYPPILLSSHPPILLSSYCKQVNAVMLVVDHERL